jgi:SMC interacting uncharacterized protein involved in chromosome segregation
METIEELKKKIAELTDENGYLKSELHIINDKVEVYERWYKEARHKYTALVKKVKAWSVLVADTANNEDDNFMPY